MDSKFIAFNLVRWYGNECFLHDKDFIVKIKKRNKNQNV